MSFPVARSPRGPRRGSRWAQMAARGARGSSERATKRGPKRLPKQAQQYHTKGSWYDTVGVCFDDTLGALWELSRCPPRALKCGPGRPQRAPRGPPTDATTHSPVVASVGCPLGALLGPTPRGFQECPRRVPNGCYNALPCCSIRHGALSGPSWAPPRGALKTIRGLSWRLQRPPTGLQ